MRWSAAFSIFISSCCASNNAGHSTIPAARSDLVGLCTVILSSSLPGCSNDEKELTVSEYGRLADTGHDVPFRDPWGRVYLRSCRSDGTVLVRSVGIDGKRNTLDDVVYQCRKVDGTP